MHHTRGGVIALLLLLPTSVAALQVQFQSRHSNTVTPRSTTTRRHYRVLDQEEESTRRRLRMPFWKKSEPQQEQYHNSPDKKKKKKRSIRNVHELRQAVLDDGMELRDLQNDAVEADVSSVLNHEVLALLAKRYKEGSVPGHRSKDDTSKLALSIEGGGMRGAVSAGMASAVACLGLCDAFDAVYGASAGSIIGAYMVSRQMCVDVYTQVLPAAKQKFVCKKRLVAAFAIHAMDLLVRKMSFATKTTTTAANPGMNISFVLDGIMDRDTGLRPFDFDSFQHNNVKQPLRVASSGVRGGKLESLCFGADDFMANNSTENGKHKHGLFRCLQASMTVPGATGPPVPVWHDGKLKSCFDAFCFEPIPYRSAVAEGATHVLVLRSRPQGFVAKTKPGVYEKAVTPLYFATHGQPTVSDFFEKGGQQYIYLEDILTLEQGKHAAPDSPIPIPPADLLYGVEPTTKTQTLSTNRDTQWNKAHVLPVTLPKGTPELSVLEQGQDKVLEGVRMGFATAYDLLAPAIGVEFENMTGAALAELVFPNPTNNDDDDDKTSDEEILETPLHVRGTVILPNSTTTSRRRRRPRVMAKNVVNFARRKSTRVRSLFSKKTSLTTLADLAQTQKEEEPTTMVQTLLRHLPGIQPDKLPHLARGLQQQENQQQRQERRHV